MSNLKIIKIKWPRAPKQWGDCVLHDPLKVFPRTPKVLLWSSAISPFCRLSDSLFLFLFSLSFPIFLTPVYFVYSIYFILNLLLLYIYTSFLLNILQTYSLIHSITHPIHPPIFVTHLSSHFLTHLIAHHNTFILTFLLTFILYHKQKE